jgi:hypothetical protein
MENRIDLYIVQIGNNKVKTGMIDGHEHVFENRYESVLIDEMIKYHQNSQEIHGNPIVFTEMNYLVESLMVNVTYKEIFFL